MVPPPDSPGGRKRASIGAAFIQTVKAIFATSLARRLAAGVVLLVIGYELFVPMVALTSSAGWVSADLVQIHAEQGGSVTQLYAHAGDLIHAGFPVAVVMANTEQGEALEYRREVERLAAVCEAYREQRDKIQHFADQLDSRSDVFTQYLSQFDLAMFHSSTAASKAYDTQAASLGRNLKRRSVLSKHGWTSYADRDTTMAEQAVAAANAGTAKFDAEAAAIRVGAATRGFLLDSGTDGASYFVQKQDEISIRLIDLDLQLKVSQSAMNSAADRLRTLLNQGNRLVKSPVSGLIWQQYASRGQSLTEQAPIVDVADSQSIFVLATPRAEQISDLRIGDKAVVQVDGVPWSLKGTIKGWILDPASSNGFAVVPHANASREAYVVIALDPTDKASLDGGMIGRRAAIVFPRPGWTWLANLIQVL